MLSLHSFQTIAICIISEITQELQDVDHDRQKFSEICISTFVI